jgi:hypothetical protein
MAGRVEQARGFNRRAGCEKLARERYGQLKKK